MSNHHAKATSQTVKCPRCRKFVGLVGKIRFNHRPGCDIAARPEQIQWLLNELRARGVQV